MKAEQITTERRTNGILLVTLNTPPLNLQTLECMERLEQIVTAARGDHSVRAMVLTGAGNRVFCAGSDVKEFPALRNRFVEDKLRRENEVFSALAELPFPTVAALNGSAMGGGCELALCCDFRIASETAKIGLPEIALGNFPGSGGPYRLTRLVGPARATELMCRGSAVDAWEAHRLGLVHAVATPEHCLDAALELAGRLISLDVRVARALKELVYAASYETAGQAMDHARKAARTLLDREAQRD